jgi:ATP-dependent DNA helicase RecQ
VLKGTEKVFQKIERKVEEVEEIDDSLFEALRRLRKEIAELEKVPPYIVFSDNTLHEMCKHLPSNENQFRAVKGVGEQKFIRYGLRFIDEIIKYAEEHGLKLTNEESSEEVHIKENKIPSHIITLNSFKEGKSAQDIAKDREIALSTVQQHIIRCAEEGMDVDLGSIIPVGYEKLILDAIERVGSEKLKPIKEELPDDIDYLMIKAVLFKRKKEINS